MTGLLLAVLTTAGTACGGSDGETASPPETRERTATPGAAASRQKPATPETTVTREEYIAAADRFCTRGNAKGKDLNTRFQSLSASAETPEAKLEAVASLLERGYANQRASDRKFREIRPPATDRPTIEKLWRTQGTETALLGRLVDAAKDGDVQTFISVLEEQKRVRVRSRGLAEGYGLRECESGKSEAE